MESWLNLTSCGSVPSNVRQNRPELKQRYDAIALPSEPLNYRNPFLQGGRTENFAFNYKAAANEEIVHIDVVRIL